MHEILKTTTFNFFLLNILKIIQNLSTYFLLFIQFFKYNIQANESAPDNTMLTTSNSHVFNTTKERRNYSLRAATASSLLYGFPQEHFHFVDDRSNYSKDFLFASCQHPSLPLFNYRLGDVSLFFRAAGI